MDAQLRGLLIASAVATPYVAEILRQVPLLTRVMSALPAEVRAGLPPHPRRPWLALFGSTRFFLALFRYALRTDPREALFGVALIVVVIFLWRSGWRPL